MSKAIKVSVVSLLLSFPVAASSQSDNDIAEYLSELALRGTSMELESFIMQNGVEDVGGIEYIRGFNLLHIAAANRKDATVVDVLVAYGADLLAEDYRGRTPIYAAVDAGNVETIERLFSYGGSYLHVGSGGYSALTYCEGALKYYPRNKACLALTKLHVEKTGE